MMRLSDSDLQLLALPSLNHANSGMAHSEMEASNRYHSQQNGNRDADPEMGPAKYHSAHNRLSQEELAEITKTEQCKDVELDQGVEPNTSAGGLEGPSTLAGLAPLPGVSSLPTSNGSTSNGTSPSVESSTELSEDFEQGFLPVLKNRNFLALWSGQVFSQLADKVYLVLMIALIASRFQAEDQTISGWVSSIMIAFTIPAVLFGSVAGALVDRWPKKPVLVITNLLRGGLVLTLPPLLWISQGWAPLGGFPIGFGILLGVTFLVSTLTQFFAPAEQSVIPLMVERRHLLSANSLYTTTMMASVIIGFAVGEPLLAIADHLTAQISGGLNIGKELVVGGGYAIAGIILLMLRTGEKITVPEQASPHIWQDVREGLDYLRQQTRVRSALIQLVILFSIFAALAVLAVRLAEVIPGIKSSQFGFLLAAGGVGMAGGATILGQFGQRFSHNQLSLIGSIGMAASLLGLALFTHQLWPVLVLLTSLGGFAAIVGVPMQTTIQEETPEEMRGKIFGLQNNAINIALTLPLALAGVAETFLGLRAVFVSLALLAIAGGLLTWYISRTGSNPLANTDKS
ncbi:MFS transporter [Trichocoleus sp. FACHB-262]|uniref:MFS transporter n=1 Tax=Trichocoleus sp. FACHB-262 TaxID=2692869 RepID=UPI00168791B4|nr:MFS transporter [Trichocoleus sp. FACHB-262]